MKFSGEHYKSLDDRGRVGIPREFRDVLVAAGEQEGLVVTKNLDGGLTAYPFAQWEAFVERLDQSAAGKKRTALNRLYIAPKTEVMFDKQGRIPLSKAQRRWAGINDNDREVVVVGNFTHIDIFSPDQYNRVVERDVELIMEDSELVEKLDLP